MFRSIILLWSVFAITVWDHSALAGSILDGRQMVHDITPRIHNIDTATLTKRLQEEPDLLLVDVRTPDEVRSMGGTIDAPNNRVIPRGWLEFRVPQAAPDPDIPIVVYCGANIRSPLAAWTLQQMGYRNVANYANGYLGWRRAGLPTHMPQ